MVRNRHSSRFRNPLEDMLKQNDFRTHLTNSFHEEVVNDDELGLTDLLTELFGGSDENVRRHGKLCGCNQTKTASPNGAVQARFVTETPFGEKVTKVRQKDTSHKDPATGKEAETHDFKVIIDEPMPNGRTKRRTFTVKMTSSAEILPVQDTAVSSTEQESHVPTEQPQYRYFLGKLPGEDEPVSENSSGTGEIMPGVAPTGAENQGTSEPIPNLGSMFRGA